MFLLVYRQPGQRAWLCVHLLWLVVASCSAPPGAQRARDSLAIVRDSTAAVNDTIYQARLAKYRRASAVIDSLTELARRDPILRTDSLYRIYRLALRPEGVSATDVQLAACLESALDVRFGQAAGDRVVKQLLDTVFRDVGKKDALEFFLSRAPSRGGLESSKCDPEPVTQPSSINGTSVNDEPRPPSLRPGLG
jgi:hypothetical protein